MNVQSSRLPLAHMHARLLASGVGLGHIGPLCRKMPNACTVGLEDLVPKLEMGGGLTYRGGYLLDKYRT